MCFQISSNCRKKNKISIMGQSLRRHSNLILGYEHLCQLCNQMEMLLLLADSRSSHQSCFARRRMRSTPARWNWFPTGKKDFITRRNILAILGGRWVSWKRCSHENTIEIYYKKATILKRTKFTNFINVPKTMTLRAI